MMSKSSQIRPKPKDFFPIIDIDSLTDSKASHSLCGRLTPIRNKYIMSRFEHDLVQFAQVSPPQKNSPCINGCSMVCKNGCSAATRNSKLTTDKRQSDLPITRTICLEGCRYDVVRRIALELTFCEVTETDFWNILWTDTPISLDKANEMRRLQHQNIHHSFYGPTMTAQKTNHFPGMHEICRKDRLARNLNRMRRIFPEDYEFYPHTWILPTEIPELLVHFRSNRNQTIICKPDAGCQGKGIFLVRNLKKMNPFVKLIAQVYIPNPLLIDGYKFDLRIYVLITSCDPLRVHVYNEGIARFATVKYATPNDNNMDVVFMHLTNYSLNKYSQSYVPEPEGSKRKLSTVYGYLLERGFDVERMVANIDDVIVKTVIAAQPTLRHYYHASFPAPNPGGSSCFEILGFDILIDDNLKPWLLEVNLSPSFNLDLAVDAEIKEALLRDTFGKIFLGSIRENPTGVPEVSKSKKKGIVNQKTPEIEIMDKAGNQIPNNLQKQFYHEQLNQGNFRLVYPTDNAFKYHEFLNPEVNVIPVNDIMVPISRREGVMPTFNRPTNDRQDGKALQRSSAPPCSDHVGRQRKVSCQHHKDALSEGSSRPNLAPPVQRKSKLVQKSYLETQGSTKFSQPVDNVSDSPPKKTKRKIECPVASMAEPLQQDGSSVSVFVNYRDGHISSNSSELNLLGPDPSERSFASTGRRTSPPPPRSYRYGFGLQPPTPPVRFENDPKMYITPARGRMEGIGHLHSAVSEPTRTEVTRTEPSKNKLVEEWILNGVTATRRKPKANNKARVMKNPKWDNFAHEALRTAGTGTAGTGTSSRQSYNSTKSLPCPALASEEYDRREQLKERERAIRQLGIEGKIFQMMQETGTLTMEEDLIYNKIFSEEEFMANRNGSSTLLEPRRHPVLSSPRPPRSRSPLIP